MAEEQSVNDLNNETIVEESATLNRNTPSNSNIANKKKKTTKSKKKSTRVKKKRRKKKTFLSRFSVFELTAIILGIFIAAALIAIFWFLYNSALKSNKAIPKSGLIASDEDDTWMTRVVNTTSPLSAEFEVATSAVTGAPGMKVDSRATKDTVDLLDHLKKEMEGSGEDVNINASYTSVKAFSDVYNTKVQNFMENDNFSYEEAVNLTNTTVRPPGTDEHSTGLLINFGIGGVIDPATFKNSMSYEWLRDNAWKYGYIERYPEGKENVTLHQADPTSFRYVGKENAKAIHEAQQTLEEYNAAVAQQEAELAAQEAADEAARKEADQAAQGNQ